MNRLLIALFLVLLPVAVHAAAPEPHAVIRGKTGRSEIVITTTARLAGAIDSLTWNGREFIDSFDHGRQLQSAANFDAGTPITNETFNPTEAGSCRNGHGPRSSSRLLEMKSSANTLESLTQMAFWLAPGEKSGKNPAKNRSVLSNHLLRKRVCIGYKSLPNVIAYDVTFTVPRGEGHRQGTFEALTGYMPAEFSRFLQYDAATASLQPLSDGPGEQSRPVVLSLPSGTHAMGIYAPPHPGPFRQKGPTYGRNRFAAAKVVKWNCVFRVRDDAGLPPGDYSFRMFVVVGDLATVRTSLQALDAEFK